MPAGFPQTRGYDLSPWLPFILFKTEEMGSALKETAVPFTPEVVERRRCALSEDQPSENLKQQTLERIRDRLHLYKNTCKSVEYSSDALFNLRYSHAKLGEIPDMVERL
jgi:hypothetical protein